MVDNLVLGNSRFLAMALPFQESHEIRAWTMAMARVEELIDQEPRLTLANRASVLLWLESPDELLAGTSVEVFVVREVIGFVEIDQQDLVLKDYPARQVVRHAFDPGLLKV